MLEPHSASLWNDKEIEDFLFYHCPECHFQSEYEKSDEFVEHCKISHPSSAENFLSNLKTRCQ